ncbi:MAG: GIY-YIG nuclease family protein [Pseudomonadota bacterium]
MERQYFVYILISKSGNAVYTGMTSNLRRRLEKHQTGNTGAHTHRYRIRKLVYFEIHHTLENAYLREKRIKRWRRQWKIDLIESVNPGWRDVAIDVPY